MYHFQKLLTSGKWKYCTASEHTQAEHIQNYIKWCEEESMPWRLIKNEMISAHDYFPDRQHAMSYNQRIVLAGIKIYEVKSTERDKSGSVVNRVYLGYKGKWILRANNPEHVFRDIKEHFKIEV